MRVVIAPDSFKGTLTARAAASAMAAGWRASRPDDDVAVRPMSDGGDGLLDVIRQASDRTLEVEVADPLGHPRLARFLFRDGTAIVESAEACGLQLVPEHQRNPLHTTTYGVGQLIDAARSNGADRILVGLGGSATADGGAGALAALGFQLSSADGSGLKIGGEHLIRIAGIEPRWVASWEQVEVVVLADVRTRLLDAPKRFGPQKGATPSDVARLEEGLARWADVVERDLAVSFRDQPGSGAAGGLGFGLAAGLGASIVPGAEWVAELVGLPSVLAQADLVVTGEGELDAGSAEGKVVGALSGLARASGTRLAAVVGRVSSQPAGIDRVVEARAGGDETADGAELVRRATQELARTW